MALNPGSLWGPHTLNEGEEEDVKEGMWSAEESVAGENTDVESGALIESNSTWTSLMPCRPRLSKTSAATLTPALPAFSFSAGVLLPS